MRPLAFLRAIRRQAGRRRQGQIAVAFIVFIALLLFLASVTMNLGEVARLKTATANAADAGALAGASLVASGENELAFIARAMWARVLLVQAIFLVPFCLHLCWLATAMSYGLVVENWLRLKQRTADPRIKFAWRQGQTAALAAAVQNARIDDLSAARLDPPVLGATTFRDLLSQIQALKEDDPIPSDVTLKWRRQGADQQARENWVKISVSFPAKSPNLTMKRWGPWYSCWSIPIPPFCMHPGWGWQRIGTVVYGSIPVPVPGICGLTCFPVPWKAPGALTRPDRIEQAEGDLTITVTHHREGGSKLGFWTMRYPQEITSGATAHYNAAKVKLWPDPRSKAQLVGVR